jgi:tetratricopeptide (TPR) repeat protein
LEAFGIWRDALQTAELDSPLLGAATRAATALANTLGDSRPGHEVRLALAAKTGGEDDWHLALEGLFDDAEGDPGDDSARGKNADLIDGIWPGLSASGEALAAMVERHSEHLLESLSRVFSQAPSVEMVDAMVALHEAVGLSTPWVAVVAEGLLNTDRAADALLWVHALEPTNDGETRERALLLVRAALAAEDSDEAIAALVELPLSLFNDQVEAAAGTVVEAVGARAVPVLVRLALSMANPDDVMARIFQEVEDGADPAMARAVAAWALNHPKHRDQALRLAARHAEPEYQSFFQEQNALRTGADWPELPSVLGGRARAFQRRSGQDLEPPPPGGQSLIWRARHGSDPARARAWQALASEAARQDDLENAALLLRRSGTPMPEAPLLVRLVCDEELSNAALRADAIAESLAAEELPQPDRIVLAERLRELDESGWAGPRHRATLQAVGERHADSEKGLFDAHDLGQMLDLKEALARRVVKAHGGNRSALAALAAYRGDPALANLLDPRVISDEEAGEASGGGPGRAVEVARWEAIAAAAQASGDAKRQLGALLIKAGLAGFSEGLETQIMELADGLGRADVEADGLGRQALLTADGEARAATYREQARLLGELGRVHRALSAGHRAALSAPQSLEAALSWREWALKVDHREHVTSALEACAARAPDEGAQIGYLVELAGHLRQGEEDLPAAIDAYDRILAANPDHVDATIERAGALNALGRGDEAAEDLLRRVEEAKDPDRAHRLRTAASDLLATGGRRQEAVDLLIASTGKRRTNALRKALKLASDGQDPALQVRALLALRENPTDAEEGRVATIRAAALLMMNSDTRGQGVALLEEHLRENEADVDALARLALAYEEDGQLIEAAQLHARVAATEDAEENIRSNAAREAAALFSALGKLDEAGPLAEQALVTGIQELDVISICLAHRRAEEKWTELDELLGLKADLENDPTSRARIWVERAQIREAAGFPPARTIEALVAAFGEDPSDERTLTAMREAAGRFGDWEWFYQLIDDALPTLDDAGARLRLFLERATIETEHWNDTKQAQKTLDEARQIAPDDPRPLIRIALLRVRTGDMDGVLPLVESALEKGDVRLPGVLELARGDGLLVAGDRDRAIVAFERAADDDETADTAWDRLLDLAVGLGDKGQLLDWVNRARLAARDEERRVRLLRREAELASELNESDRACAAFEALYAQRPGDAEAFAALQSLLTERKRLEQLDGLFDSWIEASSGTNEEAERLASYGAWLLEHRHDEARALEAFDGALEKDRNQPIALVNRAALATAQEDHATALPLMDRIDPEKWPQGHAALLFERARAAHALGHAGATKRLKSVLEKDPHHLKALRLLADRSLEAGDDMEAEFAFEALAAAVDPKEEPARKAKILCDLARLRIRQDRDGKALAAAEDALLLAPQSADALDLVSQLREKAGLLERAAESLASLAALSEGHTRVDALKRRARLLEDADDTGQSARAWLQIFEETGEERAEKEAKRLAADTGDANLLSRLGLAAGSAAKTSPGVNLLHEQIREHMNQGRHGDALNLVEEARRGGATDGGLLNLGLQAARALDDPTSFVRLAQERLKQQTDPKEAGPLSLEAGRAARDSLGDLELAASLLYIAHEQSPEDLDLRLELTQLYARIPKLLGHAETGVLQLLRHAPDDGRVFLLGADVALAQGDPIRAKAMEAASNLLLGQAAEEPDNVSAFIDKSGSPTPLVRETVLGELLPSDVDAAFFELMDGLSRPLESVLTWDQTALVGAQEMEVAGDTGSLARLMSRLEHLFPGRPVQWRTAPIPEMVFIPGEPTQIILPADLLQAEAPKRAAALGRALAAARMIPTLAVAAADPVLERVPEMLRALLLDDTDINPGLLPRVSELRSKIPPDVLPGLRDLAVAAYRQETPPDLFQWRTDILRFLDRVALFVSGSVVAAMSTGPLPELKSGQAPSEPVGNHPRALKLCLSAAQGQVWQMRRAYGLQH